MAYVVDSYNKYDSWDREHAQFVFAINGQWFAIKEIEMDWGLPQLQERVDRDREQEAKYMCVYDTYEDALQFVKVMKGLNAR